jgi:hypothetical protein
MFLSTVGDGPALDSIGLALRGCCLREVAWTA